MLFCAHCRRRQEQQKCSWVSVFLPLLPPFHLTFSDCCVFHSQEQNLHFFLSMLCGILLFSSSLKSSLVLGECRNCHKPNHPSLPLIWAAAYSGSFRQSFDDNSKVLSKQLWHCSRSEDALFSCRPLVFCSRCADPGHSAMQPGLVEGCGSFPCSRWRYCTDVRREGTQSGG